MCNQKCSSSSQKRAAIFTLLSGLLMVVCAFWIFGIMCETRGVRILARLCLLASCGSVHPSLPCCDLRLAPLAARSGGFRDNILCVMNGLTTLILNNSVSNPFGASSQAIMMVYGAYGGYEKVIEDIKSLAGILQATAISPSIVCFVLILGAVSVGWSKKSFCCAKTFNGFAMTAAVRRWRFEIRDQRTRPC